VPLHCLPETGARILASVTTQRAGIANTGWYFLHSFLLDSLMEAL